jgi:hypothetical protein
VIPVVVGSSPISHPKIQSAATYVAALFFALPEAQRKTTLFDRAAKASISLLRWGHAKFHARHAAHTLFSINVELSMSLVVRDASPSEKRGNAMAAALAKEQLAYAVQIVREVVPQSASDGALIGAVVQAIASNYAAVPQPNR